MDQPLANFHGIQFRGLRSPILHTHFWWLHACTIFSHSCNNAMLSYLLPNPSAIFWLRGESLLFSFVCWSSSTTPLKPETPGPSHLSNSLRTRLITPQVCVVMLSVSFFYHCLAFCTALSPFTHDIVIL